MVAEIAMITLLLSQMAKLERSMSTYLAKRVVTWNPWGHGN
jgi:hypothetical protein